MENYILKAKRVAKKAAVLVGATALAASFVTPAFAATLADLPAPFVENGQMKATIVVGTQGTDPAGLAYDVSGAIDLAAAFAQKATSTTAVGTATAATVEGGVQIKQPGVDFTYGDTIATVKGTIKGGDISLLEDQTYSESKGNTANDLTYTQKITFQAGTGTLTFTKNDDATDEKTDTYLKFKEDTAMYKYEVNFGDGIKYDNTDATTEKNDFEGTKITLLGKEYTITDVSGTPGVDFKMNLLAGDVTATQDHGTSVEYTVNGKTYTVTPYVYSSSNNVVFEVTYDGKTETTDPVSVGQTVKLEDGLEIGLKSMQTSAKEGVPDSATFYLGAQKLTLEDGKAIKKNNADIEGWDTTVTFDGSAGTLKKMTITVTPENNIWLEAGDKWIDEIFGGFGVYFTGLTKNTEEIYLTTSSDTGKLKFTNNNGDVIEIPVKNDGSDKVWFGSDIETSAAVTITQDGNANAKGKMWIADGDNTWYEDATDWATVKTAFKNTKMLVVGTGGEVRVFEITDIKDDGDNNLDNGDEVTLKDLTSGNEYTVPLDGTATDVGVATIQLTASTGDFDGDADNADAKITATDITTYTGTGDFKTSLGGFIDLDVNAGAPLVKLYDNTNAAPGFVVGFQDGGATTDDVDITKTTPATWYPEVKDSKTLWALDSNSWGALAKYDSDNKDDLTIYYPEEEVKAGVWFAPSDANVVTQGTVESVSVNYITPGIGAVDTDINTDTLANPVILVGGPAVNKLVADLVAEGKTQAASDYEQDTAIIQLIENAFGNNAALIVAGYDKEDTRLACRALANTIVGGTGALELTGDKVVLNTGVTGYSQVTIKE